MILKPFESTWILIAGSFSVVVGVVRLAPARRLEGGAGQRAGRVRPGFPARHAALKIDYTLSENSRQMLDHSVASARRLFI